MIVGICGQAGSGKDTVADMLIKRYRFVRVGLADPLKRICKEVYDFSDDQLWGPSDSRNAPDDRYPRFSDEERIRLRSQDDCPPLYLSARYALQTLGTEWGQDCYGNTWVEYGLRVARKIEAGHSYDPARGVSPAPILGMKPMGVVFSDFRFRNEIEAGKKVGKVVRVKRPGYTGGVGIVGHASEEEQKTFTDDEFDYVIHNVGTLEDLSLEVDRMMLFLAKHNSAKVA